MWILDDQPIRVSFDTKGYAFYKGSKEILGTPLEANLRLIAVKGEQQIEIRSVADLEGRVTIKSPEEALEFVRLFTSIATHYLFPDSGHIEPVKDGTEPGPGEYTEEYEQRMKLEPARARQEDEVFVIDRKLLDRAGTLFRATERVSRGGDYSLIKTVTIDEHPPMTFPIYQ